VKSTGSVFTVILAVTSFARVAIGQTFSTPEQAYASYFEELRVAESQNFDLWDRDMYGPVLLVNPQSREVFANFPDRAGALVRDGDVYHGRLPENININNTMTYWNGVTWAMVMLPLPPYKPDRITLLAHELFHVAQQSLGFKGYSPDNSQLDQKDGRIYLRLELEALRKALEANTYSEMKINLTNAFIFRECRYSIYPQAKFTENLLELNEGLAEYTGFMVSNRSPQEAVYHFEMTINEFVKFPTFVRSFAYETIPAYGYLLQKTDEYWNKDVTEQTNLTDFFIREFGITIPSDFQVVEHSIENRYDGPLIRAEETSRESLRDEQVAKYMDDFIKNPHLVIRFEQRKLTFDPTDVIPLDDKGNVYPNIRVTDIWGILDVHNGALMSPHWDMITVGAPTSNNSGVVSGDGWTLHLTPGYSVVQDPANGNYFLVRQPGSGG